VNLDAEWQNSYKRQVEVYQWLLRQRGFKVSDKAYFVYTNGRQDLPEFANKLIFVTKLILHSCDSRWVEPALHKAAHLLRQTKIPASSKNCKHCIYVQQAASLKGLSFAQ